MENFYSLRAWIQTVWHPDDIPEKNIEKVDFEKKQQTTKNCEILTSMKELKWCQWVILLKNEYKSLLSWVKVQNFQNPELLKFKF